MSNNYYNDQESVANIYVGLVERGWKCYGYKADESDSMTDYYSPARWDGIAEKNGFVLLVDVYGISQSGYKKTKQGYTPDYSKIEKLKATINDRAASQNEKEASQKIIDQMYSKQKESTIIVEEYPTFKNGNPKGCNWHIEKDGNIIAKGKGAFQCDGYLFHSYREETIKKVNSFIDKIESKIAGTDQLEAVQEEVTKKVVKPVEVKTELNNFVKDQTIIKLNSSFTGGHYKGELLQLAEVRTYNNRTLYTFVKLGKKYQQLKRYGAANNTLMLDGDNIVKWLSNGSILTMELKEVEEVTYKTVYKKINRKGQEENLLSGEVAETVEETKQPEQKEVIQNNDSLTVELIYNTEKNGIELKFNGIPSEGTRQLLKENGFRWSKYSKVWYIKQSEKAVMFAEAFISAFNDTIETPEEVEETPVNEVVEVENITPVEVSEEVETIQETTENNPYNNDIVLTPKGYYCYFKAWFLEVEAVTELLEKYNIPYYELGEKFFFEGVNSKQLKLIQIINNENGSILFDHSEKYKETPPEQPTKKNNVIDFTSKLKAKQEKQEVNDMKDHFINNIMPYIEMDELNELQQAYKSNDENKLNQIWQRLMLSTAVKRAAEEMLKQN